MLVIRLVYYLTIEVNTPSLRSESLGRGGGGGGNKHFAAINRTLGLISTIVKKKYRFNLALWHLSNIRERLKTLKESKFRLCLLCMKTPSLLTVQ